MNKEKIDALLIEAQAAVGTVMDQPTVAWKIKQARLELYAPDDPPTPKQFVPPEMVIAYEPDDEGFYGVYLGDIAIDKYDHFDKRLEYFRCLAHAAKVGQKGIEWLRSFEGESDKECGPAEDIIDEWDKGNEI